MNWTKYIFTYLLPNWLGTWKENAIIWWHLMSGKYDDYVLMEDEIPFEECRGAFWANINTDWTDTRHQLNELMELMKDENFDSVNIEDLDW